MRFRDRLAAFFYGRNGVDGLYYGLLVLFLITWILRTIFAGSAAANIILILVQLAAVVWLIFRAMSKNIYARRRENDAFMKIVNSVKNFFVLQKNKVRDIKDYRYKKCPNCKAVLRLPKKKGEHSVVCPKCKRRFDVKVRI